MLSLVSIAKKAGKIASGEFQTEAAVKSGTAHLVIISVEASENTKKKFRNMCDFRDIPAYCYGSSDRLGAAIGCEFRVVLAVQDQGFAEAVEKKLAASGQYRMGSEQEHP